MHIFSFEDKSPFKHVLQLNDLKDPKENRNSSNISIIACAKLRELRASYENSYALPDNAKENLFKNIIIAYGCQRQPNAEGKEDKLYYIEDYKGPNKRSLVRGTEEAWLSLQQKVLQEPNKLLFLDYVSEAKEAELEKLYEDEAKESSIKSLKQGQTLEEDELAEIIAAASTSLPVGGKISAKAYGISEIIEDPIGIACGHNEYNIRLLTSFFIHLKADHRIKSLSSKEVDKTKHAQYSFLHHKRKASQFIHNHTFREQLPGRLEETYGEEKNIINVVNFLNPKFLKDSFSVKDGEISFSLDQDQEHNNDLRKFLEHKLTGSKQPLTMPKISLNKVTGSFGQWAALWQELLANPAELEEALANHQNSKILESLKNSIDSIGLGASKPQLEPQNSEIDAAKSDPLPAQQEEKLDPRAMQTALETFRDKILTDANFLYHFSGNKEVMKTQQYFRELTNKINIWTTFLEENPSDFCKGKDSPQELQSLSNEINMLLVGYDLALQGECFSYQNKIAYFTNQELNQLACCFKELNLEENSEKPSLDLRSLLGKAGNGTDKDLINRLCFNFNKDEVKNNKNFSEDISDLLKFTEKINGQELTKEELIDFSAKLEKICSCKIRPSYTLLIRDKSSNVLRHVPIIGGDLSNLIHPSRARYENDPTTITLGTGLSTEIRKGLTLSTKEFKTFGPLEAKEYLYNFRNKLGLVGPREQLEWHLNKAEAAFSVVFHSAFALLFCFYIAVVIVAHIREKQPFNIFNINSLSLFIKVLREFYKLNLFPNHPQFNRFSYYALGMFSAMILICVIEPIVEFIVQGVFSCLIVAFKYIDQFIFGRLFTKLFTVISDLVSALIKNISLFTQILSKNITEHGLINGLSKTWEEANICGFLAQLPKNTLEALCESWKECDRTENLLAPNTWSFNIFNPIGSVRKIHDIYEISKQGQGIRFHYISGCYDTFSNLLKNIEAEKINLKTTDFLMLHKFFIESKMLRYPLEISQASLAGFNEKKGEIEDPIFKASFLDGRFNVKQYYKSLAIFTAAGSTNPSTALASLLSTNNPDTAGLKERKKALDDALRQIAGEPDFHRDYNNFNSVVFRAMNQKERIFKRTNVHQTAINGLIIYRELLEENKDFSEDTLLKLDQFFSIHLANAKEILSIINSVTNGNHELSIMGAFRQAFSYNLNLEIVRSQDMEELCNIDSALRAFHGKTANIFKAEKYAKARLSSLVPEQESFLFNLLNKLAGVPEIFSCDIIVSVLKLNVLSAPFDNSALCQLLERTDFLKLKGHQEQREFLEKLLQGLQPGARTIDETIECKCRYPSHHSQEAGAEDFINKVADFLCCLLLINFIQGLFTDKPRTQLENSIIKAQTCQPVIAA